MDPPRFSEITIAGWLFISVFPPGIDSRIIKEAEFTDICLEFAFKF